MSIQQTTSSMFTHHKQPLVDSKTSSTPSLQEKTLKAVSPAFMKKIEEVKEKTPIFTKAWKLFTSYFTKTAPEAPSENTEKQETLFPVEVLSIMTGYIDQRREAYNFLSEFGLPSSLPRSEAELLSPDAPEYAEQAFKEIREATKNQLLSVREKGTQEHKNKIIQKFIEELKETGTKLSESEKAELAEFSATTITLDLSNFKKNDGSNLFSQKIWETLLSKFPNIQTLVAKDSALEDADLEFVAQFKSLTHLNINENRQITLKGLLKLKDLPLSHLHIAAVRLSRQELQTLFKTFPNISALTLEPTGDATYPYPFDDFLLLPKLTSLHFAQGIPMNEVAKLQTLHIKDLTISPDFDRASLQPLVVGFPELETFSTVQRSVQVDFSPLSALQHLHTIRAYQLKSYDERVSSTGLHSFRNSALRELLVTQVTFTKDEWRNFFRSLPQEIRSLSLIGNQLRYHEDVYVHIRELRELRTLVIELNDLSDTGFMHIGQHPTLETLRFSLGEKISFEVVQKQLTKTNFPSLQTVHIDGPFTKAFTEKQFNELQELRPDIDFIHNEEDSSFIGFA